MSVQTLLKGTADTMSRVAGGIGGGEDSWFIRKSAGGAVTLIALELIAFLGVAYHCLTTIANWNQTERYNEHSLRFKKACWLVFAPYSTMKAARTFEEAVGKEADQLFGTARKGWDRDKIVYWLKGAAAVGVAIGAIYVLRSWLISSGSQEGVDKWEYNKLRCEVEGGIWSGNKEKNTYSCRAEQQTEKEGTRFRGDLTATFLKEEFAKVDSSKHPHLLPVCLELAESGKTPTTQWGKRVLQTSDTSEKGASRAWKRLSAVGKLNNNKALMHCLNNAHDIMLKDPTGKLPSVPREWSRPWDTEIVQKREGCFSKARQSDYTAGEGPQAAENDAQGTENQPKPKEKPAFFFTMIDKMPTTANPLDDMEFDAECRYTGQIIKSQGQHTPKAPKGFFEGWFS